MYLTIYRMFVNVTLLFVFLNKMLVIRAGIHKMYVRVATGKTLIRLLLQKQSDLGLHCLSRSFCSQLVFEILEH